MNRNIRSVWIFFNNKEVEVVTPIEGKRLYAMLNLNPETHDLWKVNEFKGDKNDFYINPDSREELLFKSEQFYSTYKEINQ